MKLSALLLSGFLMTATTGSFAQSVAVPEFKNKVLVVNKDNTLADLDNTDLQTEYKAKLTGSGSVIIKAGNTTSAVKKSGTPEEHYIVKIDGDTDPADAVELFKYDVQKKNRSIVIMTVTSVGESQNTELPKQKLKFTKVQDGVWEINTVENLAKGEYFFLVNRPNIDVVGAASGKALKGFSFSVE